MNLSWKVLKVQIDLTGLKLHIDIFISDKIPANFDIKLNLRAIISEKPKPTHTEVSDSFVDEMC